MSLFNTQNTSVGGHTLKSVSKTLKSLEKDFTRITDEIAKLSGGGLWIFTLQSHKQSPEKMQARRAREALLKSVKSDLSEEIAMLQRELQLLKSIKDRSIDQDLERLATRMQSSVLRMDNVHGR